jgi:hypothetical protein
LEPEKSNVPESKKTADDKYKFSVGNQENEAREDYKALCIEEHPGGM